jgi:uncharacterized DUF497 family protein
VHTQAVDRSFSGFDWDEGNRAKCGKHGMSLSDIESVFSGSPRIAPDPKHSGEEDRFIAVGRTRAGRSAFVAFTFRRGEGTTLIRPVSAALHAPEGVGTL